MTALRQMIAQRWAEWQTARFIWSKGDHEVGLDVRPLPQWPRFYDRYGLLEYALSVAPVTHGLVCEFGVGNGRSINRLADLVVGLPVTVYGFDSFQGLPADWRSGFSRGRYAQESLPVVRSNVRLVTGLFRDTLPVFVNDHPDPAALFHIDCDLYESTWEVLRAFQLNLGEGSVIVFDEFFRYPGWKTNGEYLAFSEFMTSHPRLGFRVVGYVRRGEQLAVQIMRDGR